METGGPKSACPELNLCFIFPELLVCVVIS
jgi:hypothetical protein